MNYLTNYLIEQLELPAVDLILFIKLKVQSDGNHVQDIEPVKEQSNEKQVLEVH